MPLILRETVHDAADLRFVCPTCRSLVGPLVGEVGFNRHSSNVVLCPWCKSLVSIEILIEEAERDGGSGA